jgi:hypothetical protein
LFYLVHINHTERKKPICGFFGGNVCFIYDNMFFRAIKAVVAVTEAI